MVILTLRLLSSPARVGRCNVKVMLSRSRHAVCLAKPRAFPCHCSGRYQPRPRSWERSYCTPPSSINTKMKGFTSENKDLVVHICFKALGSYIKMKYYLIFSANTPNLQWLQSGLVSSIGAFYPMPSSLIPELAFLITQRTASQ